MSSEKYTFEYSKRIQFLVFNLKFRPNIIRRMYFANDCFCYGNNRRINVNKDVRRCADCCLGRWVQRTQRVRPAVLSVAVWSIPSSSVQQVMSLILCVTLFFVRRTTNASFREIQVSLIMNYNFKKLRTIFIFYF